MPSRDPRPQPQKRRPTTLPNGNMIVQIPPPQHHLPPLPLPRLLVKHDIPAPLRLVADGNGIAKVGVLGQPLHADLVVAPVAVRELDGRKLLHNVAHHGVEDVEERFVGKGADFFF